MISPAKRLAMRKRGLGQTPTVSLPTCASVDATQTIPQAVLTTGGSLAIVVGIVGAIFSDQYRKEFAIAAGAGLVASLAGSIWAVSSFSKNFMNPQCTGAGLPGLGPLSVQPDQTTPPGQVQGLFGAYAPDGTGTQQPTAANPQITNPPAQ
jgi:hypothetical protein